jgi:hypothetical protein
MEIEYEIVPTDITYYSKEAAVGTSTYYFQVIYICTIGILFMISDLILALVAVIKNDGSIEVQSIHILPRLIIYFAILGISYVALMTFSKAMARKAMNISTGKNGLFCEHTITLDEKGFNETTEVNRNFLSWECVDKITETKNYVSLRVRLGSSYFIPKRAFSSADEIKAFVSTASKYIEAAQIPPPPDFSQIP